jgi:hypothetical protein
MHTFSGSEKGLSAIAAMGIDFVGGVSREGDVRGDSKPGLPE